jgi:DNA-binding protein YbaB
MQQYFKYLQKVTRSSIIPTRNKLFFIKFMLDNIMGGLKNLGNITKLKAMYDELKKIEIVHEQNGIKVVMRGDLQVKLLEVDGVVEGRVMTAVNEAIKKVQVQAAQKQMQLGNG